MRQYDAISISIITPFRLAFEEVALHVRPSMDEVKSAHRHNFIAA